VASAPDPHGISTKAAAPCCRSGLAGATCSKQEVEKSESKKEENSIALRERDCKA